MPWKNYSLIFSLLLTVVSTSSGLETLSLLDEGRARLLLEKKNPIQADVKGRIAVSFDTMLGLYESSSMLLRIQQIYRDYVVGPEGVEFEVVEVRPNFYAYVNRNEERTIIEECCRLKPNEDQFDLVLYTEGKRFFGAYEAVIHVQLERGLNFQITIFFLFFLQILNFLSLFQTFLCDNSQVRCLQSCLLQFLQYYFL